MLDIETILTQKGFMRNIAIIYSYPDIVVRSVRINLDARGDYLTHDAWQAIKDEVDTYFQQVSIDEIDYLQKDWERERLWDLEMSLSVFPSFTKTAPESQMGEGFVYVLQAGPYFKIGHSADIDDRIKQLSTLPPFDLELVCSITTPDMVELEKSLHIVFANKRKNGEWFELTPADVEWLKGL